MPPPPHIQEQFIPGLRLGEGIFIIVVLSTIVNTLIIKYTVLQGVKRQLMIVYTPFWNTLKKKNISTYMLINKYNVSSSTIARLRHNKPLSTTTLNDLCYFLDCTISEIAEYKPDCE